MMKYSHIEWCGPFHEDSAPIYKAQGVTEWVHECKDYGILSHQISTELNTYQQF